MKSRLDKLVSQKLVSVQKHPIADLWIYNYTPKVQYDKLWDSVTLQARGLILDKEGGVVCKPFKKFFNYEEHTPDQIPNEPFDVYEKMDGSLGILYWINDKPFISTRGAFYSDQAIKATEILHSKYASIWSKLNRNHTYLFEIIYPENRIVVDYGDTEDLVLLAIINNITGEEYLDHSLGFPVVQKYDGVKDISLLKSLEEKNKEGFVIRFKSGMRMKVKFTEYVRLHRILTGISNVSIWEYLSEGRDFDELLEKVPDEFYDWVNKTIGELNTRFDEIKNICQQVFRFYPSRKETALYFMDQDYPSVLFAMLDGKKYDHIIWKLIKPKYCKPFKVDM